MSISFCLHCQQPFNCGASNNTTSCWCMQLPYVLRVEETQACLCSSCLKQKVMAACQVLLSQHTVIELKKNMRHYYPHDNTAQVEGIDYYIENGLWVFTAWHHLRRGSCCKNGCRHCPYQPKSIVKG